MKKKTLLACLAGAGFGITVSMIITIIISFCIGDGSYHPVVPELTEMCGSEIIAVLVQTISSALYGAAWVGAAFIWKVEKWSLLRQTVTHFVVCSLTTLPVAFFMYWMPHTFSGFVIYFAIFIAIYVYIWLVQYFAIKRQLNAVNKKMCESK